MLVIPSIDILMGKSVVLEQGDVERKSEFSQDPFEVAKYWAEAGCQRVHVIDLDGARTGKLVNIELIERMAKVAPLQVGGGIRNIADAERVVSAGAKIILGSSVVKNPELLMELQGFKNSLLVSLDARKGKVVIQGWLESTQLDPYSLAKKIERYASGIIFTVVERDGIMKGPDFEAVKKMASKVNVPVY
ncbi:1-(5-phosphoribosyl)-5-((5-phosphoribosylamino)methylideneamino)imidazole-4-carboxamide isomerase, partial [Candidatus Parvarchaeota archaeon]|nr:1-(5-phosphoribosyl)-5-((5-phosphoribosylamino)methylideneamino)imidazole-4-carboxamide isomerase [Candidatus Parvarchaeota archaeon]